MDTLLPVEPLAPGYTYLRDADGVIPHAHLMASMNSTLCGRSGTRISNFGVTQMRRCPECDIAAQLL